MAGPGTTTLPIMWVGDFNTNAQGPVITGVPSATGPCLPAPLAATASGSTHLYRANEQLAALAHVKG